MDELLEDPRLARVDRHDQPVDVVCEVNRILARHGLQLIVVHQSSEVALYEIVDHAAGVDAEIGTLDEEFNSYADGYGNAVERGWENIPDAYRDPRTLTRNAFHAGEEMARVAITTRARIAAILAEGSRQRAVSEEGA